MLVIIGGSGMLFEASRILTQKSSNPVILCGRHRERYEPILLENEKAQFVLFDFSKKEDFQRLEVLLDSSKTPLTLLAWVHSPYYPYLVDLIKGLGSAIKDVYLVKGSSNHPFLIEMMESQRLVTIQLGRHQTEDRWLTNHEISQQVVETIQDYQDH